MIPAREPTEMGLGFVRADSTFNAHLAGSQYFRVISRLQGALSEGRQGRGQGDDLSSDRALQTVQQGISFSKIQPEVGSILTISL
jgi:hypothetical protein